MKTLFFFLASLWAISVCSQIPFTSAARLGNANDNIGLGIKVDNSSVQLMGYTSGTTDFGIGSTPLPVNANAAQDVSWASYDKSLQVTNCANNLNGNGYDFLNGFDWNATNSKMLTAGHFKGTISVLSTQQICGSSGNCGFLAIYDNQCQITDFKKFESSGNISLSDVKWASGGKFLVGFNYSGSFSDWGQTFTATGNTDAYLGLFSDPSTKVWGVTISAAGYEFIDKIHYRPSADEITALLSIDPFQSGPVTYSSSSGFSTTINPTSWAFNNVIMKIRGSDGNLLDYTVIGSDNNLRVSGVLSFSNKTIIGGTANGTLFPDLDHPGFSIANKGAPDGVLLSYDDQLNYLNGINLGGIDPDWWSRGPDFIGSGTTMHVEGAKSYRFSPPNQEGVVFFIDEDLNVLDSLLIKGSGNDAVDDADFDDQGNLYITGEFQDSADFDPSASKYELLSAGGYDLFLAKYDASSLPTSIQKIIHHLKVSVFPVPVGNRFYIQTDFAKATSGKILVQDINGRTLFEEDFRNQLGLNKEIGTQTFLPGVLFVQVKTDQGQAVEKVVLQR